MVSGLMLVLHIVDVVVGLVCCLVTKYTALGPQQADLVGALRIV